MRIGRTLPPAASPIGWKSFFHGLVGLGHGEKELERFKGEFCSYFGKRHCFLVSSGKAALTLILRALKERYPGRSEVIIPAYTCYSVPSAIVRAGLEIRLCDLAENSFDFNYEQLAPMLESKRVLAVLSTHLFGLPANVARLQGMTDDPEITVIEDAAQAMGSEYRGRQLGTLGDVGFFSLGRGKALSTVEGGVILTNDNSLAEVIQNEYGSLPEYTATDTLKLILYAVALNLLMHPWLFWLPKSLPFLKLGETIYDTDFSIKKLTSFQAGLGRYWRNTLANSKQIRSMHVSNWESVITGSFTSTQESTPYPLIRFPVITDSHQAAISIMRQSEDAGLGIAWSYPTAIHRIQQICDQFRGLEYPNAVFVVQRLITLPVHQYLSNRDVVAIARLFSKTGVAPLRPLKKNNSRTINNRSNDES